MSGSGLRQRELRIAPVMTGGTSLSVWMGGATLELYRMLHATVPQDGVDSNGPDDVYGRLLRLTATRPVVDVITGTSAGGLNGSILAAALAWGVPVDEFERLDSIWMASADMSRLLWKGERPHALLDGDTAFVGPIVEQLSSWAAQVERMGDSGMDVDLVTTFTAVAARRRTVVDDFADHLDEQTYAGTVRFTSDDFTVTSGSRRIPDAQAPDRLAWASRASASIPGVFAPVFLNTSGRSEPAPTDLRSRRVSTTVDYGNRIRVGGRTVSGDGVWAVDGGIVNNLPLEDALDRIFGRHSVGPVRRVVLYISPTPTALADPADTYATQPSIVDGVMKVVTAARAEGVGDSFAGIREHNRMVSRQRAARVASALLHVPGQRPPPAVMATYRRRRAEESVGRTLLELDEHLRNARGDAPPRSSIMAALLRARTHDDLLPTRLPKPESWEDGEWAWGISPIEHAAVILIGLVNRTMSLPLFIEAGDETAQNAWAGLSETKRICHEVLSALSRLRERDREYWSAALPTLVASGDEDRSEGSEPASEDLMSIGLRLYRAWPGSDRAGALAGLRRLMLDVGTALADAEPHLTELLGRAGAIVSPETATGDGPPGTDQRSRAAIALADEAEAIYRELTGFVLPGTPPEQRAVWSAIALLESHVIQTVLFGEVEPREQPVEIMQLSWASPDYLTRRVAAEKLAGTEFARLGAFVLPHWRANDFFWGQLDAAPRLIALLTDPRRLAQLGRTAGAVLSELGLSEDAVGKKHRQALEAELSFLSGSDEAEIPSQLPILTETLARRRQVEIARSGLPTIARAIKEARRRGARMNSPTKDFMAALDSGPGLEKDEHVVAVMRSLRIGEEGVRDQLRSDLVTTYATEAVEILGRVAESLKDTTFAESHGWVEPAVTWIRWLSTPDPLIRRVIDLLSPDN